MLFSEKYSLVAIVVACPEHKNVSSHGNYHNFLANCINLQNFIN